MSSLLSLFTVIVVVVFVVVVAVVIVIEIPQLYHGLAQRHRILSSPFLRSDAVTIHQAYPSLAPTTLLLPSGHALHGPTPQDY